MSKFRPKRNFSRDSNHYLPVTVCKMIAGGLIQNEFGVWRGYFRGYNIELHDMSKAGGEFVDWLVIIRDKVIFVEIKPEREVKDANRQKLSDSEYYYGELTDGEKSFFDNTGADRRICATPEQFTNYIIEIIEKVEFEDID